MYVLICTHTDIDTKADADRNIALPYSWAPLSGVPSMPFIPLNGAVSRGHCEAELPVDLYRAP